MKLIDSCELEIDFFMRLDIMRGLFRPRVPLLGVGGGQYEKETNGF